MGHGGKQHGNEWELREGWRELLVTHDGASQTAWAIASDRRLPAAHAWEALLETERHGAGIFKTGPDGTSPALVFSSLDAERRSLVAPHLQNSGYGVDSDMFEKNHGLALRDLVDRVAPAMGRSWAPRPLNRARRLSAAADALVARRGFPGLLTTRGIRALAWRKESLAKETLESVMDEISRQKSMPGGPDPSLIAKAAVLGDVTDMLKRSGIGRLEKAVDRRDRLFEKITRKFDEAGALAKKLGYDRYWRGMREIVQDMVTGMDEDGFRDNFENLFLLGDDHRGMFDLLLSIRRNVNSYFKARGFARALYGTYCPEPANGDTLALMMTRPRHLDWRDTPPEPVRTVGMGDGKRPDEVHDIPRNTAYELLSVCSLASRAAYAGEDEAAAEFFRTARPVTAAELGMEQEGIGPRGPWSLRDGVFEAGKIGRALVGMATVSGKETLVLSVRGTQAGLADFIGEVAPDYMAIWRHAEHFRELSAACQDLALRSEARLVVTGHSLGGATAETLARSMPLADAILSFGSPGASLKCSDGVTDRHAMVMDDRESSVIDERVFSFANRLDPVPIAGSLLYKSSAGHRIGRGPSAGRMGAFSSLVKSRAGALLAAGTGVAALIASPAVAAGGAAATLSAFSLIARVKSHSMLKYRGNSEHEIAKWNTERECRKMAGTMSGMRRM